MPWNELLRILNLSLLRIMDVTGSHEDYAKMKNYFLQKWMPEREETWPFPIGFEEAESAGVIFRLYS